MPSIGRLDAQRLDAAGFGVVAHAIEQHGLADAAQAVELLNRCTVTVQNPSAEVFRRKHSASYPTLTGTKVIVSLPKISITFTATV